MDFTDCFNDKIALNQLKLQMDESIYPPRIKLTIQATDDSFFRSKNFLDFEILCNTESKFNGSISIPTYGKYLNLLYLYYVCKIDVII